MMILSRFFALLMLSALLCSACAPVDLGQPGPGPRRDPGSSGPGPTARTPAPSPSPSSSPSSPRAGGGVSAAVTPPTLHDGRQYVPHDGTGRHPGGADARLRHTETLGNFWPTHSFKELFTERTLDRFFVRDDAASRRAGEAVWVIDPKQTTAFARLIDRHVSIILETYEERFGGPPKQRVRIFPDLETATLDGREPYTDAVYGSRTIETMHHLCNHIERLGEQRWNVPVLAGPYRPLRSSGYVQGRPNRERVTADFEQDWGHPVVGKLLRRKVVWGHIYQAEDEASMSNATHESYTYTNVKYTVEQIVKAGGSPEEIWFVDWIYTKPTYTEAVGIFKGFNRAWAEVGHLVDAEPHIMFCSGWGSLSDILGRRVQRVRAEPLALNISHEAAAEAFVRSWNDEIVRAYEEVYGVGGRNDE